MLHAWMPGLGETAVNFNKRAHNGLEAENSLMFHKLRQHMRKPANDTAV